MTGDSKVRSFLPLVLLGLLIPAFADAQSTAGARQCVVVWLSGASEAPAELIQSALSKGAPGCDVWLLRADSIEVRRAVAEGRLSADRLSRLNAEDLAEVGLQLGARAVVQVPASADGTYSVVDVVRCTVDSVRTSENLEHRLALAVADILRRRPVGPKEAYRLGRALLACGDAGGAADALSDAVSQAPAAAEYRAWLARALMSAGRLREAEHQVKRALKAGDTDPVVLTAAAEVEFSRGRWTSALAFAERASAVDQPTPSLHRLLGDICVRLGRTLRAVEEYRLAKDDPTACTALAGLMLKQGQFDEAAAAAQSALASEPDNTAAKELLARAYSGAERHADAVRQRSLMVLDAVEAAREGRSALACAGGKGTVHRGPLRMAAADEEWVARTVRAMLTDIEAGVRQVVSGQRPKGAMYRALQESLLASDRLQAELSDDVFPDENGAAARRRLAYSLWSQAAYELIKALDGEDPRAALGPLELVRDAARELDEAARTARWSGVSG